MRRFVVLTALAASAAVALLLGLSAATGATAPADAPARTVPVTWYNGDHRETAYLSLDEVALTPRSGVAPTAADIKAASASVPGAADAFTDAYSGAVVVRKAGAVSGLGSLAAGSALAKSSPAMRVSPVFVTDAARGARRMLSGDVIVFFTSTVTSAKALEFARTNRLSFAGFIGGHDAARFTAASPADSLLVANRLKEAGGPVKYAYPDWVASVEPMWTPTDPLFKNQWNLKNSGQKGGATGNDIKATAAWDVARGAGVTVGVIDGGVEADHPDLAANFRSDLGWDFADGDSSTSPGATDTSGWGDHGTAVAGVIAAVGGNGKGVVGVAPQANLVAYRIGGNTSDADLAVAESMDLNDVWVRSNSWGTGPGGGLNPLTPDAERAFYDGTHSGRWGRGVVYVFAAGNSGSVTSPTADFSSNNTGWSNSRYVLAVAATNAKGKRSTYSSRGANVRLNAPSNPGGETISIPCPLLATIPKATAPSLYQDLYAFRDGFLASSDTGRALTDIYYKAGARLVPLLLGDAEARDAFARAVEAWRPAVVSLSGDGSARVTVEQVDSVEGMAERFEAIADTELARAIREELAAAAPWEFIGQPVSALWALYASGSRVTQRTLAVAPSATVKLPGIWTTDRQGTAGYNEASTAKGGNYTSTFGGTSAAAPEVSGVAALVLSANPSLTWRDVQQILMVSATKNAPTDGTWFTNGAGYHVSDVFGYGRVNAAAAVSLATTWTPATTETSYDHAYGGYSIPIPDNDPAGVSVGVDVPKDFEVEWADLYMDIPDHPDWGDLQITLTSPCGTVSYITRKYSKTDSTRMTDFRFGSGQFFGEHSAGTWTVKVSDLASGNTGTLSGWRLVLHGADRVGHANSADAAEFQSAAPLAELATGTLNAGTDPLDVSTIHLEQGQQLSVVLRGAAGTNFDVALCAPLARSLGASTVLGSSTGLTYPDRFTWVAPYTGDFLLVVHTHNGSGAYTLTDSVRWALYLERPSTDSVTVRRSGGVARAAFDVYARDFGAAPVVGQTVYLQTKRSGGAWSTASSGVAAFDGYVSLTAAFRQAGTYYVRFYCPATDTYTAATSASSKVTVK